MATKTSNRKAPRRLSGAQFNLLPTEAQAARFIRARAPVRRRPGPVQSPAPEPGSAEAGGPEIVMALDRWDEFPRVMENCDELGMGDRDMWQFDVRLDLANGRRLYRAWAVHAVSRVRAVEELRQRAIGLPVGTIAVFAIRPPATLDELDEIEVWNKRLRQVRARRHGSVLSLDDLWKEMTQLGF